MEELFLLLLLLLLSLGFLRKGRFARIMTKMRRRRVAITEAAMMPPWTIFLMEGGEGVLVCWVGLGEGSVRGLGMDYVVKGWVGFVGERWWYGCLGEVNAVGRTRSGL